MAAARNWNKGNGNGDKTAFPKVLDSGLSPKQDRAAYLLAHPDIDLTHDEIAAEVGISARQLSNWKHNTDFIREYRAYFEKHRPSVAPACYKVLQGLALNANVSERDRIAACNSLLQHERNAGNVNVSVSTTVNTPAQELREKPRTELGEILTKELSTLNRLKDKVLVGIDPEPGKN